MNSKPKGFTLIELIIVVAVVAIMASITVARLISTQQDIQLAGMADLFEKSLYEARNRAFNPQSQVNMASSFDIFGYGVLLPAISTQNCDFKVFTDKKDSGNPTNQGVWVDPNITSPDSVDDQQISTFSSKEATIKNVRLLKYSIDGTDYNAMSDNANFVFQYTEIPTEQKVYFNGGQNFQEIAVYFEHLISKKRVMIIVTSKGEIKRSGLMAPPIIGGTPSQTVGTTALLTDPVASGQDCDGSQFINYTVTTFPNVLTSWGERERCDYQAAYWTSVSEVLTDNSSPAYLTWPNGWNDRGYIIVDYGTSQNFNNASVKFWTNNGRGNYPKVIIATSIDGKYWTTVFFKEYPSQGAPTSPELLTTTLNDIKPRYIMLYYIMSGGTCNGTCVANFDGLRLY